MYGRYLCILAELFLEDSKRTWATDIMGHQDIDIYPNIFTWLQLGFPRSPGQDLLRHVHCSLYLKTIQTLPSNSYTRRRKEQQDANHKHVMLKKQKWSKKETELNQWWKQNVAIVGVPWKKKFSGNFFSRSYEWTMMMPAEKKCREFHILPREKNNNMNQWDSTEKN